MLAFWITVTLTFALDRISKAVALAQLTLGERLVALPGLLEWRLSHNQGMALGFLSGRPVLNLLLPLLAILGGWLLLRHYRTTGFTRFAMALVVGGFLGNMLDRVVLGYVPDMVYFPWMPWYICNLADVAICIGVALLAASLIFRPEDWHLKGEGDAHGAHRTDRPA